MHAGRGGKVAFGGDGEHTGFDFLPLKNVNMNYKSTNWKYCLGPFLFLKSQWSPIPLHNKDRSICYARDYKHNT